MSKQPFFCKSFIKFYWLPLWVLHAQMVACVQAPVKCIIEAPSSTITVRANVPIDICVEVKPNGAVKVEVQKVEHDEGAED